MASSTPELTQSQHSTLTRYVEDLFQQWRQNRQAQLETKWEKNWNAFKSISDGFWKSGEAEGWRSDTFIQVTKSRVMQAYSLVIDLVLQGGDTPFDLKPIEDSVMLDPNVRKIVETKAAAMRKKIKGQFASCQYDRALSKAILSSAIFGEGYVKIGVRQYEETGWKISTDGVGTDDASVIPEDMQVWEKIPKWAVGPCASWISVWDIFRDLEHDDPRKGHGFIHRQIRSAYWLRKRIGQPLYNDDAIKRVLDKQVGRASPTSPATTLPNSDTATLSPSLRFINNRINNICVLEYWGRVQRLAVEEFEADLRSDDQAVPEPPPSLIDEAAGDEVECMVMVCDGEVIRYTRTEQDDRPLIRGVWEEGLEEGEAVGVADNVEDLQITTNGSFRAIEDNMKQAANVVWAVKERLVKNMPTEWRPGMVLLLKEDARSIDESIQALDTPNVVQPLIELFQICLQMADNDSMIPRIQQTVGPGPGKTAYQTSIEATASTKYIGAVIRRVDECFIEPVGAYFYDYNMRDPAIPAGEKYPFAIQGTGFQSYHDRLLQVDQIQRMLGLFMSNPMMAVNTNVRKCQEIIARAMNQDETVVLRSEEEANKLMQTMNTSPLQLAQQAKLEGEARQAQAAAQKLMQDSIASQAKVAIDRALAAKELREPVKSAHGFTADSK